MSFRKMHLTTDVELGRQVRAEIWRAGAATSLAGVRRDQYVLAAVRNRYPRAAAVFPECALAAVLRQPGPGTCSWDAARVLAAANSEPAPRPTPANYALLGSACSRCRNLWRAERVAARERDHAAQLAAAGFRPEAAGRLRTAEQVEAYQRALESLRRRPPVPTGLLWPTSGGQGEPVAVTAALRAATSRQRPPDPPYYYRRTPRRPAGEG
jgi:hypothetical protein